MAAPSKTSAPASPSWPRRGSLLSGQRWLLGLVGLFIAGGGTWMALTTAPRVDALASRSLLEWAGWEAPIEFNVAQRLPFVEGELRAIQGTSDGKKLWILGSGQMILHSPDEGRSWTRQFPPDGTPVPHASSYASDGSRSLTDGDKKSGKGAPGRELDPSQFPAN